MNDDNSDNLQNETELSADDAHDMQLKSDIINGHRTDDVVVSSMSADLTTSNAMDAFTDVTVSSSNAATSSVHDYVVLDM